MVNWKKLCRYLLQKLKKKKPRSRSGYPVEREILEICTISTEARAYTVVASLKVWNFKQAKI